MPASATQGGHNQTFQFYNVDIQRLFATN